jgi:Tfp pilus assembly protein PilO
MKKKSKLNINIKLDKSKTNSVTLLAIACFILIFGLFAIKSMFGFYAYQSRVISSQKASLANINQDQQVADNVENSYKTFVNQPNNIIGGSSTGTTSTSGNNAKIILDALPQTYDFPALMASMQSLLTIPGISISGLSGTDTSLSQVQSAQPIAIPLTFSVQGSYSSIQNFFGDLNRSVLPIDVLTVSLTGTDANLTATVTAQTYYYSPTSGIFSSTEVIQ